MPIDVIIIKAITAMVRYALWTKLTLGFFQFEWSHPAATSFDDSSTVPIIITGMAVAANRATKPATENHAAVAEISNAKSIVIMPEKSFIVVLVRLI
jgi:hypothetical protein